MKKLFVIAAMLSLVFTTGALAQSTNASLGGSVSDPSGALIPGVTITAMNTNTGIAQTNLTNESGVYQFPVLSTGTYKITAELSGFQTQAVNNFTLGIAQQARLNFTLQVGTVAQTVEVLVDANSELKTTTASVGTVLPQSQLQDLPLGSRNIQALIALSAGTGPQGEDGTISGNFAGGRISAVNVTRDGFVTSDGRYTHGEFSQTYTSPDLVEEVKIITATVDAENGRGSGQVQMATRSGTNSFRGSLFWTNRNSRFDANSWNNNLTGSPIDFENRNQFGGRIGGPLVKNKTFFFFLLDEQRDVTKNTVVGTVLTDQARLGNFRYFNGVTNQNILGTAPTVDKNGNPVLNGAPSTPLCFNIFNSVAPSATCNNTAGTPRDPLRTDINPFVQNVLLANMPRANDFSVGDGLNTAGVRFTRRVYGTDVADGNSNDQNNRDQFNVRIDHNFSSNHKLSGVWTQEKSIDHSSQAGLRSYPNGFDGAHNKWPRLYTVSFVSTLSSNMVNEARGGLRRSAIASQAPFYAGRALDGSGPPATTEDGKKAFALLPVNNGIPYQVNAGSLGSNGFMNWSAGFGSTRSSRSPLWQYGDNFSWTLGKHALKMGVEFRRDATIGWNDNNMTPQATLGSTSSSPITGFSATLTPGIGTNQTLAQGLLTNLSGSISNINEGFDLPNANATTFLGYKDGYVLHDRAWYSNETSVFFKDDFKVSKNFTMNVGLHWEYFGVPYEGQGRAGLPVAGNEKGACGISCGGLTTMQFVGKNSPHPDTLLYKNDYNNFAPSLGFSYSLPWLGKDKTVLRVGYGWSYTGGALKSANTILDSIAGAAPGAAELSGGSGISFVPTTYLSLATISLPIPQQFAPLSPVAINAPRTSTLSVYATKRINPYIQNFNFEIQRELTRSLTLDVAYVGSKSSKLNGGRNLNAIDISKLVINGETFLQAFNTTRAGGNSPFFNALLNGSAVGSQVVNGSTVTGSAALRANTTFDASIANNQPGTLAQAINTASTAALGGGGLYSANFGQTFFSLNPQFSTVNYYDNSFSSNYHSLQVQATKRLSHGLTNQFSYTFSKAIDISDGDGIFAPRDMNNANLDKGRAGFDRRHILSTNGTYEIPFGTNRAFLSNAPAWAQHVIGNWSMGAIFSYSSGSPLTITGTGGSLSNVGASNAMILGKFPDIKMTPLAAGLQYFSGIQANVADTNLPGGTHASSFTNKVITDASGNILFRNADAGTVGNLGKNTFSGPGSIGLDMNMIKRVRVSEGKTFELRVDVVNILNHPNFGNPQLSINNANFGQITTASGARRFTLNTRLNF